MPATAAASGGRSGCVQLHQAFCRVQTHIVSSRRPHHWFCSSCGSAQPGGDHGKTPHSHRKSWPALFRRTALGKDRICLFQWSRSHFCSPSAKHTGTLKTDTPADTEGWLCPLPKAPQSAASSCNAAAGHAEAENQSNHHNLFMSAENIQGNLLEEYIASVVRKYGWLWCNGNVLRAVDFCTIDGSALLQIKNKSNTENSSSSAIRTGTTIQKWYRLGTKSRKGVRLPDYKWDNLNSIINTHVFGHTNDCNMTEDSYNAFLKNVATHNPRIITCL